MIVNILDKDRFVGDLDASVVCFTHWADWADK